MSSVPLRGLHDNLDFRSLGRRLRVGLAVFAALLFTAALGFWLHSSFGAVQEQWYLRHHGTPATAIIDQVMPYTYHCQGSGHDCSYYYVAVYHFTDQAGRLHTATAKIYRKLSDHDTLLVYYLPDNPQRQAPADDGSGFAAYITPILFGVLAVLFAYLTYRAWRLPS